MFKQPFISRFTDGVRKTGWKHRRHLAALAALSAIAVIEWCFRGFSEPRKKPIVLNHKWLSTPICLLTHRLKSDTKRSSTSDS